MMERSALHFVLVVLFVLLVPNASLAGEPLVTDQGRPAEWGASAPRAEEGALVRLLAFLRGVFGERAEGVGAEVPREKDTENRMGIDPNGNS
jgi:hypothetical protein